MSSSSSRRSEPYGEKSSAGGGGGRSGTLPPGSMRGGAGSMDPFTRTVNTRTLAEAFGLNDADKLRGTRQCMQEKEDKNVERWIHASKEKSKTVTEGEEKKKTNRRGSAGENAAAGPDYGEGGE
mmetsp:Transcript_5745/g.14313  ORF Transcript_5745/g.14313 Transcript_5745/m.14313 type:complete len:124 (+) Transcript_5745:166-537(+)